MTELRTLATVAIVAYLLTINYRLFWLNLSDQINLAIGQLVSGRQRAHWTFLLFCSSLFYLLFGWLFMLGYTLTLAALAARRVWACQLDCCARSATVAAPARSA